MYSPFVSEHLFKRIIKIIVYGDVSGGINRYTFLET